MSKPSDLAATQVHCSSIRTGSSDDGGGGELDRRNFQAALKCLPTLLLGARAQGAAEESSPSDGIPVSLELGRYCLHTRGWVNCVLHYPQR